MRTIIGLCGYAASGKDTAAEALIAQRGFIQIGFADPLRDAMAALNPIVGESYATYEAHSARLRYNDAVAIYGYNEAKAKFPELRELLQRFGTEVGRNQFGTEFWVSQAYKKIQKTPDGTKIVITDVRFPNEVDLVKRLGGYMARVVRPGVEAVNGHVSDTATADLPVDVVITNDGTIEALHDAILEIANLRPLPAWQRECPVKFTAPDCSSPVQLELFTTDPLR